MAGRWKFKKHLLVKGFSACGKPAGDLYSDPAKVDCALCQGTAAYALALAKKESAPNGGSTK